jgi:predicted chitinase
MARPILAALSVAFLSLPSLWGQQPSEGVPVISVEQLRSVMPGLSAKKAQQYLPWLQQAMKERQINTPQRQAAFLAQLAVESANLTQMNEKYTTQPDFQLPGSDRDPYTARDQEDYFEYWYGNRPKLGNVAKGDGYKYRGRGPIQLTGKANYERAGKALGLDLLNNPDLVSQPEIGMRVASWFWQSKGLNQLADRAKTAEDYARISRAVNRGNPEARRAANQESERLDRSFRARIAFDDGAQKKELLAAWESAAKAELERRRLTEKEKSGVIDGLLHKLRQVREELTAVQATIRSVEDQGKQALALAKDWKKRKERLNAELEHLKKNKQRLDREAARLKGSTDKSAIAAYNQDKHEQDTRVDQYFQNADRLQAEKAKLDKWFDSLKAQHEQAQQGQDRLQHQRDHLQRDLAKARTALDQVGREITRQEDALDTIAAEREKLALSSKTPR